MLSFSEEFSFLSFPFLFFFFPFLFRAASGAYRSSWNRGWIGATAASLHHSHNSMVSQLHLLCRPQLMTMLDQILNLLSEARDWIHICTEKNFVSLTCWATMGKSRSIFFRDIMPKVIVFLRTLCKYPPRRSNLQNITILIQNESGQQCVCFLYHYHIHQYTYIYIYICDILIIEAAIFTWQRI